MTNRAFDAAVVGGGPAGMLAAITAAERGRRVVLVEKKRPARAEAAHHGQGALQRDE